jgi:hypothetical protein
MELCRHNFDEVAQSLNSKAHAQSKREWDQGGSYGQYGIVSAWRLGGVDTANDHCRRNGTPSMVDGTNKCSVAVSQELFELNGIDGRHRCCWRDEPVVDEPCRMKGSNRAHCSSFVVIIRRDDF